MIKHYHIVPSSGEARPCPTKKKCRYKESVHGTTLEETRTRYEESMTAQLAKKTKTISHKNTEFNTIYQSFPEYKKNGLIRGKTTKNGIRALMSFTDDSRLKKLEREYEYFLEIAKEYSENPNNFEICYKFVNTHPAFWIRPLKRNLWHWETYGHCTGHEGRLTLEPFFHEDGTYLWKIETGEHVYPEYDECYYDYRLDAYGNTVEEAFIDSARLINKFFNNDGTQKENISHNKPQWVLEIEKERNKK